MDALLGLAVTVGILAFLFLAGRAIVWLAVDPTACRCQRTRSNTLVRNPRCPKHPVSSNYPSTSFPWE